MTRAFMFLTLVATNVADPQIHHLPKTDRTLSFDKSVKLYVGNFWWNVPSKRRQPGTLPGQPTPGW